MILLMSGFEWYWSWFLGVIPLVALWQIGNRHRWAFLLMVAGELLWLGWAALTHQWGFIPASLIWGVISLRNWLRWSAYEPHKRHSR